LLLTISTPIFRKPLIRLAAIRSSVFLVTGMLAFGKRSLVRGYFPMSPTLTRSGSSIFSVPTRFSPQTLCFAKEKGNYTHKGPGGILSQIDHVVFRQKYRNSIKDCRCVTFRPFETDHRLVVASAQLSIRAAQPRRNPNHRRDWTQLRNPATLKSFRISCKNRYATLARGGNHKERYTAFVSAITSAADDNIPFVKPKKKRVPWEDADVERARVALAQAKSAHRRHRNDANMANVASASLALACQYTANQEKYISGQIDRIQAADESRKSSEVWRTINDLTGSKSKAAGKIEAENTKGRLVGNSFSKAAQQRNRPI